MSTSPVPRALSVPPCSALTLMRGTPDEIAGDLAAIDAKIAELTMQRDSAQKSFEFEMRANARLEKQNAALREALRDLVDAEDATIDEFTLVQIDRLEKAMLNARCILSPNVKSEPRHERRRSTESVEQWRCALVPGSAQAFFLKTSWLGIQDSGNTSSRRFFSFFGWFVFTSDSALLNLLWRRSTRVRLSLPNVRGQTTAPVALSKEEAS